MDVKKFYLYIIVISVLSAGCSISKRNKVLNFLFDGVTDFESKELITANDTLNLADSLVLADTIQQIVKPAFTTHPPYLKKECDKCHDRSKMATANRGIRKPQPDLCYQCHKGFEASYGILHAPVAGGFCTACHSPHVSKNEKLLLHAGNSLCFNCHDETRVLENEIHVTIGDANCTECHDPHGGVGSSSSVILKSEACTKCHQDVTTKYEFLHGPINTGECTACHGSHELKTDKNLTRSEKEICFYCHNPSQVLKNSIHVENKETNCTKCHNPHGGANKSFLNEI